MRLNSLLTTMVLTLAGVVLIYGLLGLVCWKWWKVTQEITISEHRELYE